MLVDTQLHINLILLKILQITTYSFVKKTHTIHTPCMSEVPLPIDLICFTLHLCKLCYMNNIYIVLSSPRNLYNRLSGRITPM